MQTERERCWPVHRRPENWNRCPLCGAPITWVRVTGEKDGDWCPVDEEPTYITVGSKTGRMRAVFWHELWDHCEPYKGGKKHPMFGRFAHFSTCPVIKQEHAARKNFPG